MSNQFLSDDHILTSGDASLVDGMADDVFAAVFTLLDAEFGGDVAGDVASRAASTTRRILTTELEVYDPQAAERRE